MRKNILALMPFIVAAGIAMLLDVVLGVKAPLLYFALGSIGGGWAACRLVFQVLKEVLDE